MLFHSALIQEKALNILNLDNGIVLEPSRNKDSNMRTYLVAGSKTYKVKSENEMVKTCSCKGFKSSKICSHLVADTERLGVLLSAIRQAKPSSRSALTYPEHRGVGRKGKQRRRQRVYENNRAANTASQQPFTEVWHNNEPFFICKTTEIPVQKNFCFSCKKEFPRGILSIIPFDIVMKHQERWQYRNKSGKPEYLPSNKLTTRYYCIRSECILNRFPYFREELLRIIPGLVLHESHKNLVRDQFGIEL